MKLSLCGSTAPGLALLGLCAVLLGGVLPSSGQARPQEDGEPTYLIFAEPAELAPLPPGVHIVNEMPGAVIVAGSRNAESLAARGFDLIRLEDGARERPLPAPVARTAPAPVLAAPPPEHTADPLVVDLVAAMSSEEMEATIQRLEDFVTRHAASDSARAAAEHLAQRFAALGLPVELDPFPSGDITGFNVIAEKRGTTRPDEIYILCGHYDSMSGLPLANAPGADDNASGTAAVLECARVLAPYSCQATIRFIAFGAEELGLVGSKFYVEQRVMPRNEDVRGVVNLDMIAFVHPSYPEWDANWYTDATVSEPLAQHVGDCVQTYTSCVLHLVVRTDPLYASDHYWFAVHGFPAVFDIDAQMRQAPDWNYNYHTIADQLVTLDVDYATEMARGALAAVAELAQVEAPMAIAAPVPLSMPLEVGPNPFAASVAFALGPGPGVIRIMDATGRVVARLGGRDEVVWDGRVAGGGAAPPGVYFYAIELGRAGTRQEPPIRGKLVRLD